MGKPWDSSLVSDIARCSSFCEAGRRRGRCRVLAYGEERDSRRPVGASLISEDSRQVALSRLSNLSCFLGLREGVGRRGTCVLLVVRSQARRGDEFIRPPYAEKPRNLRRT